MGREAQALARVDGVEGEVKALLESHELILRGALRHRFERSRIEDLQLADGALLFRCGDAEVRLELGPAVAAAWHRVLLKPPPTLRDKLGLGAGLRALVLGPIDDPALAAALAGADTADPAEAAMVIARIDCAEDLERARRARATLPLWAVYPKGQAARFGDPQVRALLRGAGWRDTKTCAVSDRLSATRYHPPRAGTDQAGA